MPFYLTGAVYIIGGVLTLAIDPKPVSKPRSAAL
jgi:hypothetical protein